MDKNTSPPILSSSAYNLINSTLYIQKGFELNSSVKAICGNELEISEDTGSSISSRLSPVVNLPYNQIGISITRIDGDNITLNSYGSNITLMRGGSWKNTIDPTNAKDDGLLNAATIIVYNHGHVPVIAW